MNNVRYLREKSGYSQKELVHMLDVTQGAVSKWERGESNPSGENLSKLAQIFRTSVGNVLGLEYDEDDSPVKGAVKLTSIPVAGIIACGKPIEAIQSDDEEIQLPIRAKADFALLCSGDSMSPFIMNGDYVLIRSQPDVENGQIAAVVIDSEATLKRVYHAHDGLILVADNPAYEPIQAIRTNVSIIGLAVGIHRSIVK